ncbi:MAG: extracellular solute-binding protein [Pseudomonadota bacterium]
MLTRRQMLIGAAAMATPAGAQTPKTLQRGFERLGRPLRILVPEGAQANLHPVIQAFEDFCGCKADLVVVDLDNINATLMLESMVPTHDIDIALPATFGIPDLVEAEAILPLDAFSTAEDRRANVPGGLYAAGDGFDGRRWGYQTDGDVYLMFYNRTLLKDPEEQARYADTTGTALDIPLTWDQVDRQMAFFHRPNDGLFGGCLFRTATYANWEWWARFHARGGLPFTEGFHPAIAGEAGIGALEAMIASAGSLTGSELGLFANWERYGRGDIYANIGWGGTQKALYARHSPMRDRLAHGPLPGGVVNGAPLPMAYFNWGWSYVVATHCPEPELAYRFCQFATDPEGSAEAVAAVDGYFDPFRLEHYEDPRIVAVYGESFLEQHQRAMSAPIPDLYIARRGKYMEALNYWLLLALKRVVTPEIALENVSQVWELTTEQVGRKAQEDRWKALYAAYPVELQPLWAQYRDG